MTKHIIWSNRELDNDDNFELLNDVRDSLNIQFAQPIIIIGDLGLWSGRVSGYKFIDSGNIRDCLYDDSDYAEWFVDGRYNLRAEVSHHDGTNYYLYRVLKDGLSDYQVDCFLEQIYQNKVTSQSISKFTSRVGDPIAKLYGWN